MEKIHLALASDANYLPGLELTRASILRSCSAPERIVWHVFDETALDGLTGLDVFDRYNTSKMPYLRLFLPEILADLDWVVYSDVDTIWNRDVCELWHVVKSLVDQEGEKSIYWVRDMKMTLSYVRDWFTKTGMSIDESRYACSGVCVMNLKKMRAERLHKRAVEIVRQFGTPPCADQDVLNLLYNRDCALLPPHWDVMKSLPDWRTPAVYHLTGVGRHFHDATPPTYPPQYQLWWNMSKGQGWSVSPRSRVLAACWPLHALTRLLPLRIRERIERQLFFAKLLTKLCVFVVCTLAGFVSFGSGVPAPWAPVRAEAGKVSVWGRDYLFGEGAMPTDVVSQGRSLLAGPIRIVCRDAAGKASEWTRKGHLVLDRADEYADLCAWQGNANVVVDVSCHAEFDGFMKFSVSLVPGPSRGASPSSVWLEIPFKPEIAKLYQYNPMLKWGEFDNAGGIHAAKALPFVSSFWIGDDAAGIGWFCENEAPLEVADRQRVIEIVPGERETVFRVHLADKPVALPSTWVFALEATPVKPWRETVFANRVVHAMGMATLSTTSKRSDRWWTADHAFPDGLGTVDRELDFVKRSGARTIAFHEDWIPVQNCALYQSDFRRIVDAAHARGLKVIVYQGYEISPLDPIWGEHGAEWITRGTKGEYSDLWYREPAQRDYRGCYNCGFKKVWMERLMRAYDTLGLDGVYLDGTASPLSCANTKHGCGQVDSTGVLRETHPIFSTREQMKAIYRFVHARGGIVNVHQSTYMGVATLAFVDSTWDGEQIAFSSFDPKENLTLEGIRAELAGRNYGICAEFLAYEKGKDWLVEDALALMMIHGTLVRPCGFPRIAKVAGIWDALDRFGIVDAEFVPYWKNPVDGLPERVFTSQYRKNGETLAIVSNLNKSKALKVAYPLPAGKTSASDAVTGEPLSVTVGKANVDLAPFRMRLVTFK